MSCSTSSAGSGAGKRAVSAEQLSDWFGRATEVVYPCQAAADALDVAIRTAANDADSDLVSMPVVVAAGTLVEQCTIADDSEIEGESWAAMSAVMPTETDRLREWVVASTEVGDAALIAAAGNFDSRRFVGALFDAARRADAIADEAEALVVTRVTDAGLDAPAVPILHRWNAPDH